MAVLQLERQLHPLRLWYLVELGPLHIYTVDPFVSQLVILPRQTRTVEKTMNLNRRFIVKDLRQLVFNPSKAGIKFVL